MKLVKFFAAAIAAVAMFASCEAPEGEKTNNNNGQNGPVTVELIKIYCDVTATGWDSVGVWAWSIEDTTINYTGGKWPGENLTETEEVDGVQCYVWNCPKDLVGKKIGFIVNQFVEGGEQTEDITIEVVEGMVITLTEKAESGKWLATGGEVVVPEEKPEPVLVFNDHSYGLIGAFNDWAADVVMDIVDGWAVGTIEVTTKTVVDEATGESTEVLLNEFKVRLDGAWDDSYGFAATEEMPLCPVDGTQFAATYNGGNLKVAEAGTYEVSFTVDGENEYFKVLKK